MSERPVQVFKIHFGSPYRKLWLLYEATITQGICVITLKFNLDSES